MKHPACIFIDRGWVELEGSTAYRYIANKDTSDFLDSQAYKSKEGVYWPALKKTSRTPKFNEPDRPIQFVSSYEMKRFNLVSRYTEYAPVQVIEALKFLCEIQKYCLENGHFLETHMWNVILSHGRPLLIDIGDFFKYKKTSSDDHKVIQSLISSFRESEDNHSPIHFSKFIANYRSFIEDINKALHQENTSIIDKVDAVLNLISQAEPTTKNGYWTDYAKEEWTETKQIPMLYNNKSHSLCEYIKEKKPKTVFDVGCNNGIYSLYAASLGAECMGVDTDATSVQQANRLASSKNLNASFVCYDIMKDQPAYSLNGVYQKPTERFISEMVIAPAVYHHLFRQGHSSKSIVTELVKYSSKYLCLEFIPHNDTYIDTSLTSWDMLDNVLHHLKESGFETVIRNSHPYPRVWIMAEKK